MLNTIKNSFRAFDYLILNGNLRSHRVFLALSSVIWSSILFFPGDQLAYPAYRIMEEIMPEFSWAILFLIHFLLFVYNFGRENGKENPLFILLEALICGFLWILTTSSILICIYPPRPGMTSMIVQTWVSIWFLLRTIFDFIKKRF